MLGREKQPKVVDAIGIDLWPLDRLPPIDDQYITDCLEDKILRKGETISIPYFGGDLLFEVVFVWPDMDVVRVTQDTVTEISQTNESKSQTNESKSQTNESKSQTNESKFRFETFDTLAKN